MRIELDCGQMTDKQAVHAYLKQALSLPEYYGNNLDALFDVLTELEEPVELVLTHSHLLCDRLGSYGEALLETLQEASEENPTLCVILAESHN